MGNDILDVESLQLPGNTARLNLRLFQTSDFGETVCSPGFEKKV